MLPSTTKVYYIYYKDGIFLGHNDFLLRIKKAIERFQGKKFGLEGLGRNYSLTEIYFTNKKMLFSIQDITPSSQKNT